MYVGSVGGQRATVRNNKGMFARVLTIAQAGGRMGNTR